MKSRGHNRPGSNDVKLRRDESATTSRRSIVPLIGLGILAAAIAAGVTLYLKNDKPTGMVWIPGGEFWRGAGR